MTTSVLNFTAAFGRSKAEIPGTTFTGGYRSQHHSAKNVRPGRNLSHPIAVISFSMGKAVASMPNVLGFGKAQTDAGERYFMELERPNGTMVLEYDPSSNTFYHTCQANGKACYHMFELISGILLAEDAQGEFAEHFHRLDFSRTISDEENFCISCDALYFDGKDRFEGAEIEEYDPSLDRRLTVDLTSSIFSNKTGSFTIPVATSSSSSNAGTSSRGKQAGPVKLDFGRTFTPQEEALMKINDEKVGNKDIDPKLVPLLKQMASGKVITALFTGDAGTGKTTAARIIARMLEAPVYAQNYGVNSEELHIIGGFVPDEQKGAGAFKWVDGPFTKAFRDGGVYIGDEFNLGKPGVLGALNNALDGVGELVVNGEVIQRHPCFRFFACMNIGYAGTQRMNAAMINRMNRVVQFADMPREKQVEVVLLESGYKNRSVIEKMVDCGMAIRDKIREEQIDGAVFSIRNLVSWASEVVETNDILDAAWSTVVWPVCLDDPETQKDIYEDIIDARLRGVRA